MVKCEEFQYQFLFNDKIRQEKVCMAYENN
jgi:hypothetical protein